jgi:hypothetical protein
MIVPIEEGEAARDCSYWSLRRPHQLAGLPIDKVDLRTSWATDTLVFVFRHIVSIAKPCWMSERLCSVLFDGLSVSGEHKGRNHHRTADDKDLDRCGHSKTSTPAALNIRPCREEG